MRLLKYTFLNYFVSYEKYRFDLLFNYKHMLINHLERTILLKHLKIQL